MSKEQRERAMEQFLDAYKASGNIRASCMAAGIDRQTVYYWTEHYDDFSFKYHEADAEVDDLIDAELMRRAVHGDQEPVVSMGKVVHDDDGSIMYTTKRSDQILMFIAKARMTKYREKQQVDANVMMSGQLTTTGEVLSLDTRLMSAEQLTALKQLALQMKSKEQESA